MKNIRIVLDDKIFKMLLKDKEKDRYSWTEYILNLYSRSRADYESTDN